MPKMSLTNGSVTVTYFADVAKQIVVWVSSEGDSGELTAAGWDAATSALSLAGWRSTSRHLPEPTL